MKSRSLAAVLSALLAVGATAAVFLYVRGVKHQATGRGAMTTVIVGRQDIPAGSRLDNLISSGGFTTLQIPANAVVQGAITDLNQLHGRTTNSFLLQGEQITTARLQGSTAPTGGVLGIPA